MLSVSLTRKVSLLQACKEDDCPDIETAITLMRPKPREKLLFKIYKPAAEMIREDVESALQKAVAEEQEGAAGGSAGGCCDDDEHDHDHEAMGGDGEAAAAAGAAAS